MPQLSLDSLTLTNTRPLEAIRAAARAGFDLVSLWTIAPSMYPHQLLTRADELEYRSLLADSGLEVYSIEALDLTSEQAILAAREGLELGARLGGKAVVALHFTNPDRQEAAAALALLGEQARDLGMDVLLEPVAMGQTRTLAQATALIDEAGTQAGLLFDTYHFARVGGRLEDISNIHPSLIRYVQVCDGLFNVSEADWIAESLEERLYPGDGEFPLAEMLSLLPFQVPWAVETPSRRRTRGGHSPTAQAIEVKLALARLIARVAAADGRTATAGHL